MSTAPYQIKTEADLVFSFVSEGPKGKIEKIVRYDQLDDIYYNLGFGDRIGKSHEFDDKIVSNNNDISKIMATVISTVPLFFDYFPTKTVVFAGSTGFRMKLYVRIIIRDLQFMRNEYVIYGSEKGEIIPLQEQSMPDFIYIKRRKIIIPS